MLRQFAYDAEPKLGFWNICDPRLSTFIKLGNIFISDPQYSFGMTFFLTRNVFMRDGITAIGLIFS
jgi:hypothetical protein